jgi:hypothetical protein
MPQCGSGSLMEAATEVLLISYAQQEPTACQPQPRKHSLATGPQQYPAWAVSSDEGRACVGEQAAVTR